jgi:radical SAM-linked protein
VGGVVVGFVGLVQVGKGVAQAAAAGEAVRTVGQVAEEAVSLRPHLGGEVSVVRIREVILSVGQESLCEILDITLKNDIPDDEIKEMLSSKLPEGIKITAVYDQTLKSSLAKWIGVQFRLKYKKAPDECENRIRALFDREEIVISKRTKSGALSDTDIKGNALFKSFEFSEDSCLLNTYLSASEPTVNPVAVISAFEKYDPELVPAYYTITRTELYDRDLNIFR